MAASDGGRTEPDDGAGAGWKRRWLLDFVQAGLMALALFVAVILGILFIYNSTPHGELGPNPTQPLPTATVSG